MEHYYCTTCPNSRRPSLDLSPYTSTLSSTPTVSSAKQMEMIVAHLELDGGLPHKVKQAMRAEQRRAKLQDVKAALMKPFQTVKKVLFERG
jgi:hypothetical protein